MMMCGGDAFECVNPGCDLDADHHRAGMSVGGACWFCAKNAPNGGKCDPRLVSEVTDMRLQEVLAKAGRRLGL